MPHTLLFFHAHPDDEAIATSGTMAKAKADGHRVVLVLATRGELGEVPEDLGPDETLADRRTAETHASAALIGVDRVEFLGYRDSGMADDPRNADPDTFASAPLDDAADRLARLLRDEAVDVLIHYDERGNYLHPDHLKVHAVGRRAGELAETALVYQATMNRDFIYAFMAERADEMPEGMDPELAAMPPIEDFNLGMREWDITHRVDVQEHVELKRSCMAVHASQITDSSFFLQMQPEQFALSFGQEWFIREGAPRAMHEPFDDDLLAPLRGTEGLA